MSTGFLCPIGLTLQAFTDQGVVLSGGKIYTYAGGTTTPVPTYTSQDGITQNTNPIHFDRAYAAQTEFGQPLVDSTFTLALVTGQSVMDLSINVMANLGWDEVRLPNPLFEGETVYSRSEVLEKRESKSRPNAGIVEFEHHALNQNDEIVGRCLRTALMHKRPA